MKSWDAKYIGLPFESKGRDWRGVDCWGVVRLIYKTELNIELPTYGDISADDLIAVSQHITVGKDGETWQAVEREELQEFDIVVMRYLGMKRVGHVGIMTKRKQVLHVERGIDTMQVPLNHFMIRERIECFRRHKLIVR